MNKKIDFRFFSIIAAAIAIFAIICAVTVTGSGFLDLSNIARVFFIIIAVCFGAVAVLTGIKGFKK